MAEHLPDPLDYLYEELPSGEMTGARKHLAACPACRADMRAVRETVKLYRAAEKPSAPAGLAARAAQAALEEAARGRGAGVASLETAVIALAKGGGRPDVDIEAEFSRLKEEVLAEIPRGWRTWLFHPAWTVAASVIFVCALFIHLSPRARQPETRYLPSLPQRNDSALLQIRERERLPASSPRAVSEDVVSAAPAPILQEAAALNEIVELPPFEQTREGGAEMISPAAALPAPAPVPAASGQASVRPPPPEPAEAAPPSPDEPIPPAMLEALGKKTAEAAATAPVVIMNLPDAEHAPQLVERPRGYDAAERIQALTTLAGMQMAEGEFDDARKTVVLLEAYDADAARILSRTLGRMEEAAAEQAAREKQAVREKQAEAEQEPPPEAPQEAPAEATTAAQPEAPPEPPATVQPEAPPEEAVPLPDYAPYLETVEPPEDPPMSTVRVPRPEMAYGAVYAAPAPIASEPIAPAPAMPLQVDPYPSAPIFSPLVFPEAGDVPVSDIPEPAVVVADSPVVSVPLRPAPRESVYVDTPVTADESAVVVADASPETPAAVPPPPVAVYVPVVPYVVAETLPPPVHDVPPGPARRRTRPFTTDPYFRDY